MDYQLLNALNEDIRVVTILPTLTPNEESTNQTGTDLVQCRLEHVSLKDSEILQASKESSTNASSTALDWNGCHRISSCQYASKWRYSWGDYVALSYTWGAVTDTRKIILNGHEMAVGANLESLLRILRHKKPMKAGYKIWVDAICINQQDIAERSREVTRMGKIYRQAREVLIWLGNEGGESDKGMDLIRTLSNACTTGRDRALGDMLRRQPDLLGKGCWRALSSLLDRPYWDRLWVLQETSLSGGRTSILCGQQAVTWSDLYSATYSFGTHNIDVMFSLIDQERNDAGLPASGLKRNKLIHLHSEQSVQAGREKPQPMAMLDLARKSQVTDLRDKIYGMLGIMEALVSEQIVPNYHATLHQVFTNFAKAFIVTSRLRNSPLILARLEGAGLITVLKIIALNCLNSALGQ